MQLNCQYLEVNTEENAIFALFYKIQYYGQQIYP